MSPDPDYSHESFPGEPEPPTEGEASTDGDGVLRWEPKFPEVARNPGHAVTPAGEYQSTDNLFWTAAPEGSHVHSFALYEGTGRKRDVVTGESYVAVQFRKPGSAIITGRYSYFFDTAENARAAYEELRASDHPGAHPMVQRPKSGETPGLVSYDRS